MKLDDITVKFLTEGFRDYGEEIEEVSAQIYDLLDANMEHYTYYDNIEDYEVENPDEWYEASLNNLKELQQRLKDLYKKQEDEYMKEIQDLPKPTSKTSFEGFDITKTDPPVYEDYLPNAEYRDYVIKKYKLNDTYIAEVTPEEYLLLCGKYGWKDTFTDIDSIYKVTDNKDLIHQYAERMKNGEKAPMPVLNVKEQAQEGRHRAFAAIEAGIKTIPCLIVV